MFLWLMRALLLQSNQVVICHLFFWLLEMIVDQPLYRCGMVLILAQILLLINLIWVLKLLIQQVVLWELYLNIQLLLHLWTIGHIMQRDAVLWVVQKELGEHQVCALVMVVDRDARNLVVIRVQKAVLLTARPMEEEGDAST